MTGPLIFEWILWSIIPKESRRPSCRMMAVSLAVPAKIPMQKNWLASCPWHLLCTRPPAGASLQPVLMLKGQQMRCLLGPSKALPMSSFGTFGPRPRFFCSCLSLFLCLFVAKALEDLHASPQNASFSWKWTWAEDSACRH